MANFSQTFRGLPAPLSGGIEPRIVQGNRGMVGQPLQEGAPAAKDAVVEGVCRALDSVGENGSAIADDSVWRAIASSYPIRVCHTLSD
jgi:hypothetical protein